MRVTTVLRLAALTAVLSAPLASAPVAFAGDDSLHQNMASPYNTDQSRDPVYGITLPWTVLADE